MVGSSACQKAQTRKNLHLPNYTEDGSSLRRVWGSTKKMQRARFGISKELGWKGVAGCYTYLTYRRYLDAFQEWRAVVAYCGRD